MRIHRIPHTLLLYGYREWAAWMCIVHIPVTEKFLVYRRFTLYRFTRVSVHAICLKNDVSLNVYSQSIMEICTFGILLFLLSAASGPRLLLVSTVHT